MFWINFDQKIIVDDYGGGGDQGNKIMDEYDDMGMDKRKGKGYGMDMGKGKGKGYGMDKRKMY